MNMSVDVHNKITSQLECQESENFVFQSLQRSLDLLIGTLVKFNDIELAGLFRNYWKEVMIFFLNAGYYLAVQKSPQPIKPSKDFDEFFTIFIGNLFRKGHTDASVELCKSRQFMKGSLEHYEGHFEGIMRKTFVQEFRRLQRDKGLGKYLFVTGGSEISRTT